MSECKECGDLILEVFWEGPFTQDEIIEKTRIKTEDKIEKLEQISDIECEETKLRIKRSMFWTGYSAYGSHQLYGSDVLLYIGKTTQGTSVRLKQHNSWFDEERFGDTKYFVSSLNYFTDWESSPDMNNDDDLERYIYNGDLIERVEALLIYALAPSRNTSGKNSTEKKIGNLRLFNTGALGSLPNEISGKYWRD